GVINGGLFAFVRATDPDIFLLIEARGKDVASARWQFAAARMHSMAELRLRHQNQQVWEAQPLPLRDIFERHMLAYTSIKFQEIPDFLKDAAKPKPRVRLPTELSHVQPVGRTCLSRSCHECALLRDRISSGGSARRSHDR